MIKKKFSYNHRVNKNGKCCVLLKRYQRVVLRSCIEVNISKLKPLESMIHNSLLYDDNYEVVYEDKGVRFLLLSNGSIIAKSFLVQSEVFLQAIIKEIQEAALAIERSKIYS